MQQVDSEFLQSLDRSKPYPWMLHAVVNGMRCECCGEVEYPWRPGIFDVHTDGLDELYRHMNFQIVVEVDIEVVAPCLMKWDAGYELELNMGQATFWTIYWPEAIRFDWT